MAKPRKKKSGNGSVIVKRKEIEAIVNRCYRGVRFIGDCYQPPRAMNISMLWTHLSKVDHEIGLETFLNSLFAPKEWSLGVMCAFKKLDGTDSFDVGTAVAITEVSTGYEVSCMLGNILTETIKIIQESDPTFTNDRFVYYGYFFEPEVSPRINLRLVGLTDFFMNYKAIEECKPFIEGPPVLKTDSSTIPMACRQNGIFPGIKYITYYCNDPIEDDFTHV